MQRAFFRAHRLSSHLLQAPRAAAFSSVSDRDVVIVSAVRSPVTNFCGSLAPLTGPQIASQVIRGALAKLNLSGDVIQEAILGNVISAGAGQAPTTQAIIGAGLPNTIPCTTINKVCASGMKAVMLGAQAIMTGQQDVVLAGGFESMSNVPYYIKNRNNLRLGHERLIDGVIADGLWDVYNDFHMGNCAEDCAKRYSISREEQDKHAIESYTRAIAAQKEGRFINEIIPITVPGKRGESTTISEDDEPKNANISKMSTLKTAFIKDGTVTAANSSKLNDGASALILMSAAKAKQLGLKPLARVRGFADAAHAPIEFPTAPTKAIPLALRNAGVTQSQVDYWEINQAFSVVSLANIKLLNLDPSRVDVNGGAVALGHPIGSSGSRIIVTLINVLQQKNANIGVAAICNGGGGASAIVIERL